MATFVGVHDMSGAMALDKMQANWEAYKTACAKMGLSAKHAHMNDSKGKAFCVTEATSAEDVQKAHDDAGVPVNEIIEVKDFT